MASEVKTNKISPATVTTVTLGDASDTFVIPASVTLDVNGIIDVTGATTTGFPAGGLAGVQVYTTASNTWTKATREAALGVTITKVIVEVQGGGSSGAASPSGDECSGGGGGGYAKKLVDVSSVTASVISVGAGGTAVTSENVGIVGGASSWVDTASGGSLTLTGAGGAAPSNGSYAQDGTGGTGTNGDINIQGGDGGASNGGYVGLGGDSVFGFGGSQGFTGQGVSGAARGYGAGGGGGKSVNSGAGTDGIVIVWEYQ